MGKLRIYSGFNAYYYSFYVQGLLQVFGAGSLSLSARGFPRFGHHALPFVVQGEPPRKIYLSAGDGPGFTTGALEWCDVYAKVNVEADHIPREYASKVMPIGPSFGVYVWPLPATLWRAVTSYLRCPSCVSLIREHFANYWRSFRYRLSESAYRPGESANDYIFYASSLWKRESETNRYRAAFIQAARSVDGVRFEGGFAPRTHNDIPGFEELTMRGRYTLREYVERTRRSAVVFNTPAVRKCLGWKLGEYLALGKAIISTPITRQLPTPLKHETHWHLVDGSPESIKDAIRLICEDEEYRHKLERGAREYYLEYLQPRRVITRILDMASSPA